MDLLHPDAFRLLGDPVRLRLLRLLAREPLNVGEVTRIIGVAQSGVSRHVRLLREGGFVAERRAAGWTWLDLEEAGPAGLGGLWPTLRERLAAAGDDAGDDARLAEVLREREERGAEPGAPLPPEPGRSWAAWARALGHLLPGLAAVDLGCAEGALTLEVARWAGRVVGVDPSAAALERASAAADAAGTGNVQWLAAPLDAVPLPSASADLALLAQVLHRVEDPSRVLAEAVRLVATGGRVLVLDLLPHREGWVRERLGHRRLGISSAEARTLLAEAGLEDVRVEEAQRRRGNPFTVWVASGRRAGDEPRTRGGEAAR